MCGIINATPALRFFDEIHGTLHAYGYDSKMYSLYKVRPPKGPWSMGLVIKPRVRNGNYATLSLRLDEISHDGCTVRAGLEKLDMKPAGNNGVRTELRREIEDRSAIDGDGMDSAALALFIADALDGAGISDK